VEILEGFLAETVSSRMVGSQVGILHMEKRKLLVISRVDLGEFVASRARSILIAAQSAPMLHALLF
jgi:hypothetical protein